MIMAISFHSDVLGTHVIHPVKILNWLSGAVATTNIFFEPPKVSINTQVKKVILKCSFLLRSFYMIKCKLWLADFENFLFGSEITNKLTSFCSFSFLCNHKITPSTLKMSSFKIMQNVLHYKHSKYISELICILMLAI